MRTVRCAFCGAKLFPRKSFHTERSAISGGYMCTACSEAYDRGFKDGQNADARKLLENELTKAKNLSMDLYAQKERWRDLINREMATHSHICEIEKRVEKLEKGEN